jgi:sec-independent protein translocase protein TatA
MPFNMQGMEWVILILVALLVFGGTRLAGAGKNAGRAIREFKEETRAIKADEEAAKERARQSAAERGEIADAELLEPRPNVEQKPDTQA